MKGVLLLVPLVLTLSIGAADPCAQYYGKGYCTDYVNGFLRTRMRGDASTWPANTPTDNVRKGDVAIFRRLNHVALVEEVRLRDGRPVEVVVSEQNFSQEWRDQKCQVTTNFGRTTRRPVPLSRIDGIYREPPTELEKRIQATPNSQAHTTPSTAPQKAKRKPR